MTTLSSAALSRRRLLIGSASIAAMAALANGVRPAHARVEARLIAAPGQASRVGGRHPATAVWAYEGRVPGPEIRARQGERLGVVVDNQLGEDTSVHWHGVRVPNAMDGVPHLTQAPIRPGEGFVYAFELPDAGACWYHPHARSFAQIGRGLHGALIVEEREPVAVDRDLTWVLSDWRLRRDAQLSDDFGDLHDVSYAGRIGNTVTINGRVPERLAVRAGERLRLRLINVANARIFALEFQGHAPQVIAYDGQPVAPHEVDRIVLGPGMRPDVVIDMGGRPGETFTVVDDFYRGQAYRLIDLVYVSAPPLREHPPAAIRLPPNPLSEPDLAGAERHELRFEGGMMGGMRGAMMGGRVMDMRAMMRRGMAWSINGVVADRHEPMLTLRRDLSCVLALVNDTAWHHPIHLHGHAFRVLRRDGRDVPHRPWQDTVLVGPRETVEIAFVADNRGDWMVHCHVLEHQAGGMSAVLRVA